MAVPVNDRPLFDGALGLSPAYCAARPGALCPPEQQPEQCQPPAGDYR